MTYGYSSWYIGSNWMRSDLAPKPKPKPRKPMKVDSVVWTDPLCQMPWHTNIGHELTFLPKAPKKHEILKAQLCSSSDATQQEMNYMDDVEETCNNLFKRLQHKNVPTNQVSRDLHCVEVSSEVLTSWQEFVVWNEMVRHQAKQLKLKPEVDWIGGGMGHHHIDYMKGIAAANIFRLVAARPFLAWMFVNFEDDKNAVTHASRLISRYENNNLYFDFNSNNFEIFNSRASHRQFNQNNATNGRGCVLTYRDVTTIEWRAFDAAPNMEQQIEHTAFLQALVGHAKFHKKLMNPVLRSLDEAKQLLKDYGQGPKAFDRSAKEFLQFIKDLGLPKERYEKYVETNLRWRISHGNPI